VGRRRLKIIDYGKAAITMLDMANGRAVRLCPASRAPSCPKGQDPVEFFAAYRDEELYEVQQVHVEVAPQDMPGRPSVRAVCERCGERVLDGREVVVDGVTLCRPCADGAYYELLAPPVGGPR
jgi:formylmethanofuran dehydrogenase subunit E